MPTRPRAVATSDQRGRPTAAPEVIVYTDGACSGNPGPGGWAAILRHPATGKEKKLSGGVPNTTNNKMELTGAIEGLKAIDSSLRRRVHLVSDSQYVIFGLTEWIDKWIANGWRRGKKQNSEPVKNVELWRELYALTQKHDMSYEHVRGHSGHLENEECDRLAVAAIKAFCNGMANDE
ncbi:MAG: ribonuclease HI [Planctomycetota bacterium]